MISAKIEVDSILKSNKIVILLNELNKNYKAAAGAAAATTTVNGISGQPTRSESEDYPYHKKINLINNRSNKINKVNKSQQQQQQQKYKSDFLNNNSNSNEIIKLLELYGIQKKHIKIVSINQLKNYKISELYLKSYYCNNQEVKVFILNIYTPIF